MLLLHGGGVGGGVGGGGVNGHVIIHIVVLEDFHKRSERVRLLGVPVVPTPTPGGRGGGGRREDTLELASLAPPVRVHSINRSFVSVCF